MMLIKSFGTDKLIVFKQVLIKEAIKMLYFTSHINQDKKRFIISIIGFALFAVIFRAYVFRTIDYSYTGVKYQVGNPGYVEAVNIEIKGRYTVGLSSSLDEFDGTINVGDKVFHYSDFVLQDNRFKRIPLTMETEDKNIYGDLFYNNVFKQVTLPIREQEGSNQYSWSNKDGFVISAPSTDREQAIELSNKLIPQQYRNGYKERINLHYS